MTRGAVMPGFDLRAIQVSRRSNHRSAETTARSRSCCALSSSSGAANREFAMEPHAGRTDVPRVDEAINSGAMVTSTAP
jgi:hypothetical protein